MTTEKITRRVAGVVFAAELPVRMSREGPVFHARDLRRFELAVARQLAELGVATGEALRFMRKSMGLSVVQVATLLDIEPDTVRRWENGDATVPRAAFALLGTMADDELRGADTARRFLEASSRPPAQTAGEIPVMIEELSSREPEAIPSRTPSEAGAATP